MNLPPSWLQLQLFDFLPIKDPNINSAEPLHSDPSLSAITASSQYLVVTTSTSIVKLISKDYTLVKSFAAYPPEYSLTFAKCLENSNFLVTLAERQGYPVLLKVWDLHRLAGLSLDDENDYQFKFLTQALIHNELNSFPVSCWHFNRQLTCVAIGYTNGKVVLVRGDLLRDRGWKQRVVYDSPDPVTAVFFDELHEILYVTTTSKILTVSSTGRGQGRPTRVLATHQGVDLNCADVDPKTSDLIVGTPDAIRYYSHTSRGHNYTLEFAKKCVHKMHKSFLLVVSSYEDVVNGSKKFITKVIVLDLRNRHIAFTLTIPNNSISHAFDWNGDLYVLAKDGSLYKIHEKPINQQIELILQRELFSVASLLAKQSDLEPSILLRIEKLHAAFLYDKQNYNDSIASYIKCLALLQESSTDTSDINDFIMDIIIKFKDDANISNLTSFLYELYRLKLATNDHLTLLLCCYCKLKLTDELDSFIKDLDLDLSPESGNFNLAELNYQLILNLFKECGYFDQAIQLLLKLNQPKAIVEIQLSDLNQPKQVLRYMKSLPIDDLLLILVDQLKTLLDLMPLETTQLLIEVFTGSYKPEAAENMFDRTENAVHGSNGNGANGESVTIPRSYQAFLSYIGASTSDDQLEEEDTTPTYLPPKPKIIFPSFTSNPKEFVIFLEACIKTFDKYQGNVNDKKDLLITLIEVYLSLGSLEQDSEYWTEKALALIAEYPEHLDRASLLLISHIYNFTNGEVMAKQDSDDFEEGLFRSAAMAGDVAGCVKVAENYGSLNPKLYRLLLKFVVSLKSNYEQVKEAEFKKLISTLRDLKLITPLELVALLSSTEFITIGVIKDYLIDHIDSQNKEISNNVKLIQSYELDSSKYTHKLTELVKKPFIIQNNKCLHCQMRLDFPVVHFKCKHSYHQRCLNDNNYISEAVASSVEFADTKKCPLCIGELDSMQTLRNNQLEAKDNYAMFKTQLEESEDRFKVVSDYLGKGVMEEESQLIE